MGLFRREARAITAENVLTAINDARTPGMNLGPAVNADTAMRLSAVWACIRLLAGVGSTLPIDQFRTVSRQRVDMLPSSLFVSPSPNVALTTWLYQVWTSLLLDGNAYGLIVESDRAGWPTSIEVLDPNEVSWKLLDGTYTAHLNSKPIKRWPLGPLWHVPLFAQPGKPFGLSPIANARQTIGAGMSAEQFGASFFSGGGNPNGIIYSDNELTPEQAGGIKAAFRNATSGNREPAVFGSGLKYERVQINPDEAQFIESQRFTVEQIARLYAIPPEMIGGASSGSSVTYANREQRATDWLTFGFMPYLIPLEEALSSLVPRPQRVKFNVDSVLRADLDSRYKGYKMAAEIGMASGTPLLTVNEMRALENLPPLDGGDVFAPPQPAATPMPGGPTIKP